MRAALELVRGRPFESTGRTGYHWVHEEGAAIEIESEIVDAAHRLAELWLQRGDADGARWAALRGRKVAPENEILCRDQMRAAHSAGDIDGVKAIMKSLGQLLDSELEPLDAVHPETAALYDSLVRDNGAGSISDAGRA